jgi:hypothetical protein
VRQYTDKLLSIQGAKYRTNTEDTDKNVVAIRCKQSPSRSNISGDGLAPIPEERLSFIELEAADSTLSFLNSQKLAENATLLKAKNDTLRKDFFKDLIILAAADDSDSNSGIIRVSGETRTGKIQKTSSDDFQTMPTNINQFTQFADNDNSSNYGSLKRRKQLLSASLQSLLPSRQSSAEPESETQQLTPVNPLLLSRSRSGSPQKITFTSSVKVQYKPRIMIPPAIPSNLLVNSNQVNQQPLYGSNQFNPSEFVQCPCGNQLNPNNLVRSRSTAAIFQNENYKNEGIYFAKCINVDDQQPETEMVPPERPELPEGLVPPRPPLPENYLWTEDFPCNETGKSYFLSLPRDLMRSASTSVMLH